MCVCVCVRVRICVICYIVVTLLHIYIYIYNNKQVMSITKHVTIVLQFSFATILAVFTHLFANLYKGNNNK